MMHSRLASWLCLKSAPELGPKSTLELLQKYPEPQVFVGKSDHPVYCDESIKLATKEHLKTAFLSPELLRSLELVDKLQIQYSFFGDSDYPASLKSIDDPPLVLYYRGDLQGALSGLSLAVVGTRRPSAYGVAMCKKRLKPLCEKGVTIISGLAIGIDTTAHLSALEAGSKTLAVMASGLETI